MNSVAIRSINIIMLSTLPIWVVVLLSKPVNSLSTYDMSVNVIMSTFCLSVVTASRLWGARQALSGVLLFLSFFSILSVMTTVNLLVYTQFFGEFVDKEKMTNIVAVLMAISVINYLVMEVLLSKLEPNKFQIIMESSEGRKLDISSYLQAIRWLFWPFIISCIATGVTYLMSPYTNNIVNHATIFATILAIAMGLKEKAQQFLNKNDD